MDNIFERASRTQIRFATDRGFLTVEDLWSLPLQSHAGKTNLDDIAVALNANLQSTASQTSFVTPERKPDEHLQLAFDLVKHIIDVRVAETKAASETKARADQKQKLLALIADKQDESLRGKSIDELRAELEKL